MRPRKIIAMIMTFLMMLSLLPSLVFAAAAPEGELGGQLKIKGTAAVGSELSADYEKVTPEGLTDDYVTFSWSRKVGDQLTEVGTEKTYKLVDEDLGNKIELKITGKAEMGITGELKVNTVEIVATPEEAPEETTELPEGEQEAAPTEETPVQEIAAEDTPAEGSQTDENTQPAQDVAEDTQTEEVTDIGADEPTDSSADVHGCDADLPAEEAGTCDGHQRTCHHVCTGNRTDRHGHRPRSPLMACRLLHVCNHFTCRTSFCLHRSEERQPHHPSED